MCTVASTSSARTTSGICDWPPSVDTTLNRYEPGTHDSSAVIVTVGSHGASRMLVVRSIRAGDWGCPAIGPDSQMSRPPRPP
jgi:hypothetical protein